MTAPGFILWEGSLTVAIATMKTENRKTGPMVQVWILHKHKDPVKARAIGADAVACGNCPLRDGRCYVNLGQAPLAVWRAYRRGNYSRRWNAETFRGKVIRLGAYGDPAFVPMHILERLTEHASGWTGYSHQWERAPRGLERFCMASVESEFDALAAESKGWRAFRARAPGSPRLEAAEIECPSSRGVSCADCLLCCGTARPLARSITIEAHGTGASRWN